MSSASMVITTFCTSDGSAVSPSWWAAEQMRWASSTSRLLSPSGAGALVNSRANTPSGRKSTSGA
jgi:hypothetical protein